MHLRLCIMRRFSRKAVLWVVACGMCIVLLIFIKRGHILQKSPTSSGSFARRDLHLKASFACSPLCSSVWNVRTRWEHAEQRTGVLQCVAACAAVCCNVRCSALQSRAKCWCIAGWSNVRCSVLQCVAGCCSHVHEKRRSAKSQWRWAVCCNRMQQAVCCNRMQKTATDCNTLHFLAPENAVCCSLLQSIAFCCSLLQSVAVWCCSNANEKRCAAKCRSRWRWLGKGSLLQSVAVFSSVLQSCEWEETLRKTSLVKLQRLYSACSVTQRLSSSEQRVYLLALWRRDSPLASSESTCLLCDAETLL